MTADPRAHGAFPHSPDRTSHEGSLAERQARLATLANQSPALLWVNGLDGCELVNDAYRRFLGLEGDADVRGYDWSRFVHPDDREAYLHAYLTAFAARAPFSAEFRFRRADGEWRWMRSEATPLVPAGRFDGYVGATVDITDRKRAEDALREREQQLGAMFEVTSVGMAQADLGTRRILRVNRAMCVMTGYSEDELLAMTVDELGHPDDQAAGQEAHARLVREGGAYDVERRYRRKDGQALWVHIAGTVTPSLSGPGRVFVIVRDITERKRQELALRESEDALRDADRRKNEFLAVLAHELRNPLAPIRTGLALLALEGDTAAALGRIRPIMERQVGHMVRLIDDLLDVSRITSGRIQLQRQVTDVGELVRTAVDATRSAFDDAGVALRVDLPTPPLALDVDPTRFVQVLSNVLHNAAKFTDRGGIVSVTADLERTADASPAVAIAIQDTGIGIAPAALERVFELFAQGNSAGRAASGLGIGLALARRLVEMHGGAIEAHSDGPGTGSRFVVRMPAAVSVAAPAPAPLAPSEDCGRRVLVVDDNVDAADTLAELIRALGGTARVAYDGTSALEQAAGFAPDVVLLDIGMPGLDGYETCRRLRREPAGRAAAVVALTGWGQEHDRERAFAAGFDSHLTKPADPRAIARLLADRS